MKKLIFVISIFSVALSCSKDKNPLKPGNADEPSAMCVFCQNSLKDTLSRVEYKYANDNLISEATYYSGELQSKTTYTYNTDHQVTLETYEFDLNKTEKTYVYNELNQLINIKYKFTNYDSDGHVSNVSEREAPREYENNQLVKEWQEWGGFITYEYKNGKVDTKIEYTVTGEKYHITTYTYSRNLLIEEKKETMVGGLIFDKTYTFDAQGRVVKIRDGEDTIEEDEYSNGKLIEKRAYYFGIDPGFSACNGNFIYRYVY